MKPYRAWIIIGLVFGVLIFLSNGCQTVDKGPIRSIEWRSSIAGWAIVCGDHELLVDPLCRISRGVLFYTIQVQSKKYRKNLFAIEGLKVGTNHHPRSIVFIRRGDEVASGDEPSIYSGKAKPILMSGGKILVRWTEWPSIRRSQIIRVDGFTAAYAAAMGQLKRMAGEIEKAE